MSRSTVFTAMAQRAHPQEVEPEFLGAEEVEPEQEELYEYQEVIEQ